MPDLKTSAIGALLAALLCTPVFALAEDADFSGQVRALLNNYTSNSASPLAIANQLAPGLSNKNTLLGVVETELRASGKGITAVATLQGQMNDGGRTQATAWLNELYGSLGDGAWQFSAGKKTIAWDVGYGFRPNDVVAQEKRRSLISTTVIGKPLASLEYFNSNTSVSMVWVNPGHATTTDVADEQALAARVYHHTGGVDLHGFGRYGQKSGGSLGAAASWVATDEMEVHGSLRFMQRNTGLRMNADTALLQRNSPWQNNTQNNVVQAMLGANYTTESQHSFFIEAWWDGTALSDREWQNWNKRNLALQGSVNYLPQMQQVIGHNLAWQNQALSASGNIRRKNVFARWSWQENGWQPSLDLLWTPEDNGRIVTAALGWQGDRISINGGVRFYGGPSKAILAQLPDSRTAYISATWAF
ncbi:hypothetical protein [Undibacterium umbellatum]|uniref:Uncharacterized protein n=1 Tax=Undibacterium umbellatum TaxID=2762300 RepID=A0ABR6ZC32_9BURK|nr:hypothetical protein [Undibacterium umbellatum]MBC3909248.1 hypothetical protein [Undibacterium umbellatum]